MSSRILLVALFLAGCGYSSDPIVAKIGSMRITQSEFRRKLAEVSQGYQDYVLTPNGRRQFLDVLIREKLILAAAVQSEVPKSEEFKAEMQKLKSEEAERLREGHDFLMTRLWLDGLRREGVLRASDDEIKEYHRKNPMEVSVRHILLANPDDAWEIAKQVRSGSAFAAVAKTKSLDAVTAAQGGVMPPAVFGEIIPDLEDVVFRMRVGEISGPLKSKFGYHVLRKDAERTLPLEEARERFGRLIEKQKLDRHLQSMQEKYPVEVVDAQYK